MTTGSGVRVVLWLVGAMWALEVIDAATPGPLDALGIQPRDLDGLPGIVLAPLLHLGFGHLMANTVSLVALGLLIAFEGARRVAAVTVIAALASGLGVWLLAPASSITVGASGVVFGYAAYLIARGVVSRRALHIVVGVIVLVFWGTGLLAGLVPQAGVSWQGHLFGAVGGVLAAQMLPHGRARDRSLDATGR